MAFRVTPSPQPRSLGRRALDVGSAAGSEVLGLLAPLDYPRQVVSGSRRQVVEGGEFDPRSNIETRIEALPQGASMLEKIAAGGAGLGIDIAEDPLTYAGGVSLLGVPSKAIKIIKTAAGIGDFAARSRTVKAMNEIDNVFSNIAKTTGATTARADTVADALRAGLAGDRYKTVVGRAAANDALKLLDEFKDTILPAATRTERVRGGISGLGVGIPFTSRAIQIAPEAQANLLERLAPSLASAERINVARRTGELAVAAPIREEALSREARAGAQQLEISEQLAPALERSSAEDIIRAQQTGEGPLAEGLRRSEQTSRAALEEAGSTGPFFSRTTGNTAVKEATDVFGAARRTANLTNDGEISTVSERLKSLRDKIQTTIGLTRIGGRVTEAGLGTNKALRGLSMGVNRAIGIADSADKRVQNVMTVAVESIAKINARFVDERAKLSDLISQKTEALAILRRPVDVSQTRGFTRRPRPNVEADKLAAETADHQSRLKRIDDIVQKRTGVINSRIPRKVSEIESSARRSIGQHISKSVSTHARNIGTADININRLSYSVARNIGLDRKSVKDFLKVHFGKLEPQQATGRAAVVERLMAIPTKESGRVFPPNIARMQSVSERAIATPETIARNFRTFTPHSVNQFVNGELSFEAHMYGVLLRSPEQIERAVREAFQIKAMVSALTTTTREAMEKSFYAVDGSISGDRLAKIRIKGIKFFEEDPYTILARDISRLKKNVFSAYYLRNSINTFSREVVPEGSDALDLQRIILNNGGPDESVIVALPARLSDVSDEAIAGLREIGGMSDLSKGEKAHVISREIFNEIARVNEFMKPEIRNKASEYMMAIQNFMRQGMTIGIGIPRIGFNTRNYMSDQALLSISGVMPFGREHWIGLKASKVAHILSRNKALPRWANDVAARNPITGDTYSYVDLVAIGKDYGLYKGVGVREDLGKTFNELRKTGATEKVFRSIKDGLPRITADFANSIPRFQSLIHGINRGMDVVPAVMRTKATLYDYSLLSKWERDTIRKWIPFYSWTRFNTPRMFQDFIETPARLTNIIRASQGTTSAALSQAGIDPSAAPAYLMSLNPISFFDDDDGVVRSARLRFQLPQSDLIDMLGNNAVDNAISQIGGPYAALYENIANVDNFSSKFGENASLRPLERVPGELEKRELTLGGIPSGIEFEQAKRVSLGAGPIPGLLSILSQAGALQSRAITQTPRSRTETVSSALGFPVSEMTPQRLREMSKRERDARKIEIVAARSAAERGNLSPEEQERLRTMASEAGTKPKGRKSQFRRL